MNLSVFRPFLFSLLVWSSTPVFAGDVPSDKPTLAPAPVEVPGSPTSPLPNPPESVSGSAANRAASKVIPSYSLAPGLWVPLKHGPSLGYIYDRKRTFELDYLSGTFGLSILSVDLISFHERLVTGRMRWHGDWNSFNLSLGLGERRYQFKIGDDILKKAPGGSYFDTSYDVATVSNTVLLTGIGNRWQFSPGFVVSVDWVEWLIPVGRGASDSAVMDKLPPGVARRSLGNVLSTLRFGTTFNVLKLTLGWAF